MPVRAIAPFAALFVATAAAVLSTRAADEPAKPAPDVATRAMTVLQQNCLACHNAEKKKGGLLLTSRESAIKGGDDGVVLVPGDAAKSKLIAALAADAESHMPPKGQLSHDEIATLRAWVDGGAAWDAAALAAAAKPATTRPIALRPLPATYAPVLCMAIAPDQKRLAVGRGDRVLIHDLTAKDRPIVKEIATPTDVAYSLAWSGDNQWLAVGGFRRVRVFDAASAAIVRDITPLAGRVTALTFVPNAPTLIVADGDVAAPSILRLFNLPDGKPLANWPAHADSILNMRISADGQHLATAGADKVAKVWHLPTRKEIAKLEGHAGPVMAVALSKDGQTLASAGADKEVKVWNVKTKDQTASLMTHPAGVTDLAWVNDKTLASTSEDGLARFSSEANKDRADKTFTGAPDVLYCTALTADGKTLFAGSHDGEVYVWNATAGTKLEGKLPRAKVPTTAPVASAAAPSAIRNPQSAIASTPSALAADAPISFPNDVMPVLTRAGCNAGACHAKPAGQGGFKLSVFGYDPKSDYRAIVKDARGRRVFPAAPAESLLLNKPTVAVEHGGGLRLKKDSDAYKLILRWLEQGMPWGRDTDPTLASVEVAPREGQYRRGATQALKVTAHYSDGSTRDVTHLSDYLSNEKEFARVDESGIVHVGDSTGEAVIVARYVGRVDVARVTVPADKALPDDVYAALPVNNFIDEKVYARLKTLAIAPSATCTDAEFLRRASLDVAGVLPTIEEAKTFLADTDKDKRNKLIDRLLENPNYADHWANKWGDLLRPNPFRAGVKSVYVLDQWIRQSFRENKPFDQFAREILTASGSTHRPGPVVVLRDRREPADIAPFVSQLFLGVRLECAKCHHHPNEKWGQEDFYQLAAYFGKLKRKGQGISAPISGEAEWIWFNPDKSTGEVRHPLTGEVMPPKAPDAAVETIPADQDPRESLAAWLSKPANPFFARAIVNRVWGDLLGRGIVHPVDDFRASNPPTNEPLLDALAKDFAAHHFDLKHLIRTILRSNVYQLSSLPNAHNARDTRNFSRFYRRRPPAEVALDAIGDITGVPEPLQGLAPGSRAVTVWNNRIDSEFLDAFGRPNASADPPCERERDGSVVQALHLMNSTRLMNKIASDKGRAAQLAKGDAKPEQIVESLYYACYSRPPTSDELKLATAAFTAKDATRRTATEDVLWALINSAEFVFNH